MSAVRGLYYKLMWYQTSTMTFQSLNMFCPLLYILWFWSFIKVQLALLQLNAQRFHFIINQQCRSKNRKIMKVIRITIRFDTVHGHTKTKSLILCGPNSHCAFSPNLFYGQITRKSFDQMSSPEHRKCSPWKVFGISHPQTLRLLSRRGPRGPSKNTAD